MMHPDALPLHDRDHLLHGFDGAEQIGFKHPAVGFALHVLDGIDQAEAGVVYPDIHPAEALQGGTEQS